MLMDENNILLSVNNLSVEYRTANGITRAIDDVSFTVKKGRTFAIVGESGCGKSTIAFSILRLLSLMSGKIVNGQVLFEGRNLLDLTEKQMRKIRGRNIAMIFQQPATSLNPVFTIGSQVAETVRLHQKKSGKAAWADAVDMLSRVGLGEPQKRAREYPHQLSGGMQQRVMIAMALSCRPKFLIADEPTSSLDVTSESGILDLLCRIQREENISIMLITHNLRLVADRADEVAVMQKGKIVEQGDTKKIIENPSHSYTRSLIAASMRRIKTTEERC